MKVLRLVRNLFIGLAAIILVALLCVSLVWLYFHPRLQVISAVVYGHRQGRDLTLDVLRPAKPNGIGILLMVSGGWKSQAGSFRPWIAAPLLRRGYTIFAVYHVPQPEATVMEITDDVNRAVRFVRHNAREYGVDPQRLGVTGGSAGGHLSLMVATRGGPGPADAIDPVDRESSAVQAVAIFYPVTDLLNLGNSTENLHDGGPPKSFVKAFGPQSTNLAVWKVIGHEMSPDLLRQLEPSAVADLPRRCGHAGAAGPVAAVPGRSPKAGPHCRVGCPPRGHAWLAVHGLGSPSFCGLV